MQIENLKQAALIGTMHTSSVTSDPETVLVECVQQAIQRRVGFIPDTHTGLPNTHVRHDNRPFCHPQVIVVLEMLLDSPHYHLLGEWIERVDECNWRIPPEYLSSLLRRLEKHEEHHEVFRDVAGDYLPWLAEQNTRWGLILNPPVATDHIVYDERWWRVTRRRPLNVDRFETMRSINPQRALEILNEQWPHMEEEVQIEIIFNFSTGYDDEPFLESLLDSESQIVSKFAQSQLVRIPHSRYVQRLMSYATQCLVIEKHATVEVVRIILDFELTDAMRRDGLEDHIERDDERGEIFGMRQQRRYAAHMMLSNLPPSLWCQHFQRDAKSLYHLFINSQWQDTLTQDFVAAAQLHMDIEWIRALVEANIDGDRLGDKLLKLISLLPENEKDIYFLQWWKRSNSYSRRKQIHEYLENRLWSRAFSRGILEVLEKEHGNFARQYLSRQQNEDLRQMIELIVYHIHADEIPYARKIFNSNGMKQFENALSRLRLRQEITAAFKFE
ncbi:MAG: DUF5691 domain-containing protein [Chloroflexota bacterium]